MKSGHGSCSTNRTLYGSTTTTSLTFSFSCAPLARSKLNFDVLGGERVAVVEFQAFAQVEFVDELVRALGPGFREARRHAAVPASASPARRAARTMTQNGVHETRAGLPRIEPGRRQVT